MGGAARQRGVPGRIHPSFNRRGDSLGGAAVASPPPVPRQLRFNRRGDSLGGAALIARTELFEGEVSIAGAILWGVLRRSVGQPVDRGGRSFNRRGDSLGGAAHIYAFL